MRIKNIGNNAVAVLTQYKNYLFSYGLLVAVYHYDKGILNVCDHHYSASTTKHYNKWISEYKICAEEKAVTRRFIELI